MVDTIRPLSDLGPGGTDEAPPKERKLWLRLKSYDAKIMRRIELLCEMFPGHERMIVFFADTGKRLGAECRIHPSPDRRAGRDAGGGECYSKIAGLRGAIGASQCQEIRERAPFKGPALVWGPVPPRAARWRCAPFSARAPVHGLVRARSLRVKYFSRGGAPGKNGIRADIALLMGCWKVGRGNFSCFRGVLCVLCCARIGAGAHDLAAADGAAEPEIRTGAEHQPAHGARRGGAFSSPACRPRGYPSHFSPLCAPSRPSRPARSCCRRSGSTSCPRGCPAGTAAHPVAGKLCGYL